MTGRLASDDQAHAWARARSAADLGAFVRAARERAQLSQDVLADQLGIDRRVLQRIEAGQSTLYVSRLFALMDELGIEMDLRRT